MDDAPTSALPSGTTIDRFLNGRFTLVQPARGAHRCGSDAILLAAMLPDATVGHVVDLGSGPGAAGVAMAVRTQARVTLVDIDADALALAADSLTRPENLFIAGRVQLLETDVAGPVAPFEAAGIPAGSVDHVLANPPFFRPGRHRPAPDEGRARARMLGEAGLHPWIRRSASLLRTGGTLNLILPSDLLAEVIAEAQGRFGALDILPLHPGTGQAADRILVKAVKASKAALRIMPGLVMHDADGAYSAPAKRILRDGKALPWPARKG